MLKVDFKIAQDGHQDGPGGPKTSQEGFKTAQDCPKTAQEAPETPEEDPKGPPRGPQEGEINKSSLMNALAYLLALSGLRTPKTAQGTPEIAPRRAMRAQEGPKTAKEGPKTAQESPKTPKRCPGEAQNGPREPHDSPSRSQDASERPPRQPRGAPDWPPRATPPPRRPGSLRGSQKSPGRALLQSSRQRLGEPEFNHGRASSASINIGPGALHRGKGAALIRPGRLRPRHSEQNTAGALGPALTCNLLEKGKTP